MTRKRYQSAPYKYCIIYQCARGDAFVSLIQIPLKCKTFHGCYWSLLSYLFFKLSGGHVRKSQNETEVVSDKTIPHNHNVPYN